jgi:citrate lyase subunit alpha/citrate CoA-transferase
LRAAGLPVKNIHDLKLLAQRIAGSRAQATMHEKIVAIVEYRDGTIIDVARQVMI